MEHDTSSYRFNAGRWADGGGFVGRVDLLLGVLSALNDDPYGTQIRRFIGRRRQGKTSLLQAVAHLARAMNDPDRVEDPKVIRPRSEALDLFEFTAMCAREGLLRSPRGHGLPMLPVFFDMRATRMAREMAQRVASALQQAMGYNQVDRSIARATDPLDPLFADLTAAYEEEPFMLLLLADEARGLAPTPEEIAAQPDLADESQGGIHFIHRFMEQSDLPVQFFLASSRGLDLTAQPSLRRLLDSIPVFPIGNLASEAVETMLSRSQLPQAQTDLLREDCGGNPYFLHVLGYTAQNRGANAQPQIDAGIHNDMEHVTAEERTWMERLAWGDQSTPLPASATLLDRCGYVRHGGGDRYSLREPLLERWLARQSDPPPRRGPQRPLPHPMQEQVLPPIEPALPAETPIAFDLARYDWPSRQRYGQLTIGRSASINLGAQCYVLLHLLAEGRLRDADLSLQQDDLKYPLYLTLALAGMDHGLLNPRGLISGLRTSIKESLAQEGLPPARIAALHEWLPRGRGGYRLGSEVDVLRTEHPLGHLRLPPLDLVAVYRRWHHQREAFITFIRDSAINHTRGLSLVLRLLPASDALFPRHEHVLLIEVTDQKRGELRSRLGPIPFSANQATAFRFWKRAHMDEGWVQMGRLERESAGAGGPVVRATDFCLPFEMLDLRGVNFIVNQRRWSSEWLPEPGAARDVPTSPRWLDLHLVDEAHAAPYGVTQLIADL